MKKSEAAAASNVAKLQVAAIVSQFVQRDVDFGRRVSPSFVQALRDAHASEEVIKIAETDANADCY